MKIQLSHWVAILPALAITTASALALIKGSDELPSRQDRDRAVQEKIAAVREYEAARATPSGTAKIESMLVVATRELPRE